MRSMRENEIKTPALLSRCRLFSLFLPSFLYCESKFPLSTDRKRGERIARRPFPFSLSRFSFFPFTFSLFSTVLSVSFFLLVLG